jgi:hypothetical protein
MVAKDTIYSSKAKYVGVFSFPDFYDFCYNWIMSEIEPNDFSEKSYSEKIVGDGKNIDITWEFSKKLTDYFKFNGKIKFRTIMMKKVELNQGGRKIKTNQGEISIDVKGILVRDYQNKFESSATLRMWRAIYEKWIIQSRVEQFEGKIVGDSDELLNQAKAFLDLEGKR